MRSKQCKVVVAALSLTWLMLFDIDIVEISLGLVIVTLVAILI